MKMLFSIIIVTLIPAKLFSQNTIIVNDSSVINCDQIKSGLADLNITDEINGRMVLRPNLQENTVFLMRNLEDDTYYYATRKLMKKIKRCKCKNVSIEKLPKKNSYRMKQFFLLILFSLSLTSCNFFGTVDNQIETKNIDLARENIVGIWHLDKFSYKFLSSKDKIESISINFNSNGSFVLNNSKNVFVHNFDLNENQVIIDNQETSGKWDIIHNQFLDTDELNLFFGKEESRLEGLKVYKKGNQYQILWFFNDPDTGDRLRFLKK
ncbi:hypothetical protein GV828_00910 [Flavobacterium sp. NST-5]|uniref:Lipocalin-like domain-containing protein n=1 Tax=Flavobacterium ichthyis TaxID=2698827 RepID=A0ABW9Z4J1_9FLAO|nr:hypothetical protein [Flavobacterium ichthyis]NBL63753.1 hypothetical protein [Flavobacterium ichthyis]